MLKKVLLAQKNMIYFSGSSVNRLSVMSGNSLMMSFTVTVAFSYNFHGTVDACRDLFLKSASKKWSSFYLFSSIW